METRITDDIQEAAAFLKAGQLVAFPTETVYGLGADATSMPAIEQIFAAKLRPGDNPLIVHIASLGELDRVVTKVPEAANALINAFFPGPLTLILNRHPNIPGIVSAGLSTVGVRMPSNETALALITAAGVPVAAPSANISGRPSPTTWQSVQEDLDGRIACILRGRRAEGGLESTVVDCSSEPPTILRSGSITLENLRAVVPGTLAAGKDSQSGAASPGVRYRHYAPNATVVLIDDPSEIVQPSAAAYIGLEPYTEHGSLLAYARVTDAREYGYQLFEFLRECDRLSIGTVYCQRVLKEGVGVALMDRLVRAARR